SYTLHQGLQIHAANGRGLWHINLSAPRLLQPAAGDFAIQTVCRSVSAEQPAIGGLLLWKDKENYLALECGLCGPANIAFRGCIGNKDMVIGRGRLPAEGLSTCAWNGRAATCGPSAVRTARAGSPWAPWGFRWKTPWRSASTLSGPSTARSTTAHT